MNWRHLKAFFMREYDMRRRSLMWEVAWLFYDLMWALAVGFLGKGVAILSGVDTGQDYIVYLLVGSFIWTYLSSVFSIVAWSITWEKWEETLEYTFMAPVRRWTHLMGTALFAVVYGVIRMVIVIVACSFIFDFSLAGANLLSAGVVLAVAALPFIGLGMSVAVLPLIHPEQGDKAPLMIEAAIMVVSGIYYPIAILPVILQWIAKISPATYALDGIRKAVIDGAPLSELFWIVVPLLILGIILIPLGSFIFSLGEKHAMKTGKLKRHG